MNSYEQKQEDRRARLEAAADRADERSNAAYKRADMSEDATGIPFGQPILRGHHSEGRHRAAIKRADNAMRKSVEEDKRAKELRAKAASVGTGGISSDDPDAIPKLTEKLTNLQSQQTNMKAVNRVVRKWNKKGVTPETEGETFDSYAAELAGVADFYTPAMARELLKPQWGHAGPIGFAPYQLTNLNAKIKATKKRIEQLEKASAATTKRHEFQGVCNVVENVEENRVQFIFDAKPSAEVRRIMKSHGFRWAPSQGAWQRQLTGNARYSARLALKELGVEL
ncbi:MAG: DUF3560 domain-containing protein [Pelagimonas sp.]|uniref:DUF3560 domain-containing protein n=1 Tax=Pelagimonas sp. TaxID=2073170 RepID=UPI003D6AD844